MDKPVKHFYEFGSFRVDPDERVLFCSGAPVYLAPKVFDTLLELVQHSGHIIEKEELIRKVWPDTFVEESNLTQYISVLRKTLGDGRHEQRYIETVPRRGYRFSASVREMWDDRSELVSSTHTKLSLAIKEETVEDGQNGETRTNGDRETRRNDDTDAQRYEKTAPGSTRQRLGISMSLALALFVVGAAMVVAAFSLFAGDRQRIATESKMSPAIPAAQGLTIKTFDPSVWPRSDDELGISGFVIEDFEDTTLVQGLRIELSNSTENFSPVETLPMAFSPDVDDSGGAQVFIPGIWDGSRVLINRRSLPPHGYSDFAWGDVTFHLPNGATSFGFSLHNMDLNTELFVNGTSRANLRRLLPSGGGRGGYLRIDAGAGEVIASVRVANSKNTLTSDGLAFDHVAFKPLQP